MATVLFLRSCGSSPLSRGILMVRMCILLILRIIPALAGNTRAVRIIRAAQKDHPRPRGEYGFPPMSSDVIAGSSPLSRGIRSCLAVSCRRQRIIPALAGNTGTMRRRRSTSSDHPRSRGEYVVYKLDIFGHPGSSPLSRGILTFRRFVVDKRRIIPALAGNT